LERSRLSATGPYSFIYVCR